MFQVRHKYYKSRCVVIKSVIFTVKNVRLTKVIIPLMICVLSYLEISHYVSNEGEGFSLGIMCAKAVSHESGQKIKLINNKSNVSRVRKTKTKKFRSRKERKVSKRQKSDKKKKMSKNKNFKQKNERSTLESVIPSKVDENKVVTYNGEMYKIVKTLVGTATYYFEKGRTATGKPLGKGVMAVDPLVIPYFSHLLVDYGNGQYEEGYALDTGKALRDHYKNVVVDIFKYSESECKRLGRKNVKVHIVKK